MDPNANDRSLSGEMLAQVRRASEDRELPSMSADGVVSYNLLRARELRGWTQQEAATRISEYLGKAWSVPVYAAAERAHRSSRVKQFSADELVALSQAFMLPITWWFLPPSGTAQVRLRTADNTMSADDMLNLLLPAGDDDPRFEALTVRTSELFSQLAHPSGRVGSTSKFVQYLNRQNAALSSMLSEAFKTAGIEDVPAELEELAGRLKFALGIFTADLRHRGLVMPPEEGEEAPGSSSSAGSDADAADE